MTPTSGMLETGHCGVTSVLLDVLLNIMFLDEGRLRTLDKVCQDIIFLYIIKRLFKLGSLLFSLCRCGVVVTDN